MDENPIKTPVQTTEPGPEGKPLTYEETPEIPAMSEPAAAPPSPSEPMLPPPPQLPITPVKRRVSVVGIIGNLLLFAILFGVGMWLASFLRQHLPMGVAPGTAPSRETTPAVSEGLTPTVPPDPYTGWKTYQVISSTTGQSLEISFKLPEDVLSPICDGGCISQGTYLPGGTRFTVAPRGPGLPLRDFRGRVISDVDGTAFTTEQTLVAGRNGVKFTGSFRGRTVAGYAFTRMHGYMVEVTDTLSLEINHFTPAGTVVDFEADHTLFGKIVQSLMVEGYPASAEKGATIPLISPAGSPTASPTVEPLR